MALSTPSYKSVGLIIAVALVGVIVVVATISLQNRQKIVPLGSTKSFSEATSGIVLDAPQDWTIGKTSASTIETHTYRLENLPTERSTCSALSAELSQTIQKSLKTGSAEASVQWQKEFPGLISSQILKGPTTLYSLVGIDTCNPSFNVRSITFRGQAYKNSVEVQFSHIIFEDSALSQTELNQVAQSLIEGKASADLQQPFNQFVTALGSVR
jgi:hypothetical protein